MNKKKETYKKVFLDYHAKKKEFDQVKQVSIQPLEYKLNKDKLDHLGISGFTVMNK